VLGVPRAWDEPVSNDVFTHGALTCAPMRTDAESTVIVVWVVLALVVAVASIYDAIGTGGWPVHLIVLVVGELILAGLARLAFRAVAPRR
jgi:hypothetical protein